MAPARDCYGILGVGRGVGPEALRTAYRRACLRTHPDKPGGCAVRFREVVAAYETLSEPGLRAMADAGGWSADDALRRQQARAASSATEAAKQAELLRRAEELARTAEVRATAGRQEHVCYTTRMHAHVCTCMARTGAGPRTAAYQLACRCGQASHLSLPTRPPLSLLRRASMFR